MTTEPPTDDTWPTPAPRTVVASRQTLVDPAPPPPPPVGPPPDRRIGWGMLLAIGVIALVALGILIAYLLTHRNDTNSTTATTVIVTSTAQPGVAAKIAVPRVVGLKAPQALARLTQVGLRPKEVYRPSAQAKGEVVSQDPKEATNVVRGTRVTLVVDAGAPKVSVPAVTGQTQAAAQAALQSAGLTAHTVTVPAAQPRGQVTAQHPAAGQSQPKGSTVRINVSDGSSSGTSTSASKTTKTTTAATTAPTTTAASTPPQPTTASVPAVTGSDLQAAVQQLNGAGFLASIQYIPGTDPLGTVLEQSPSSGASAKTRSHVTINASSGPGQKTGETVPDVTGQTLHGAVAGANGAHLRLIYVKLPVSTRAQAGKVVEQTPAAGKQAPQNAQILVYLGALTQG